MSDIESSLSEDESEILVYVELEGCADSNVFKNNNLKLDITGIESDHPIMQINGKFYEGTYHDAVGTYMFFEKDDSPIVDDPVFDVPATWKFFAKTRKLLKMERVFAMQRTEVLGDSDHTYCIPNMETIKEAGVPPKYQQEALQFWMNMRDDRMQALTTYLEKQQIREEKRSRGIELDSESDDDNPFAMYKPKKSRDPEKIVQQPKSDTVKSNITRDIDEPEEYDISNMLNHIMKLEPKIGTAEEFLKKPVKKLTVIDPGPSTSKQHNSDIPSMIKKKRKGMVKVPFKSKAKDVFKKPNKRAPKSKKSSQISMSKQDVHEAVEISSSELQTESEPDKITDMVCTSEVLEETVSYDEHNVEEVEEKNMSSKSMCLITKKLEKQAKREAKMKEISERLKTHKKELLQMKDSTDMAQSSGEQNA